jgi:hypothetical protein
VLVLPGGQQRGTVAEQVEAGGLEGPTAVDQEGDETGETSVVPSGELEHRETVQLPKGEGYLAVPAGLLISQRSAPEAHRQERGRCGPCGVLASPLAPRPARDPGECRVRQPEAAVTSRHL